MRARGRNRRIPSLHIKTYIRNLLFVRCSSPDGFISNQKKHSWEQGLSTKATYVGRSLLAIEALLFAAETAAWWNRMTPC